jgi:hypothetical protein
LNLKCDFLVSKFAFEWVNLYRYNLDELAGYTFRLGQLFRTMDKGMEVRAVHVVNAVTRSLKGPGFNPGS